MINERYREEKGITLVALVITIVVLIILATISINVVIQGGIIESAKKSKDIHEQAASEEQAKLDGVTNDIRQHYADGLPIVTYISDGKSGTVPLPKGFYYVGGDLDTGIVISDKQGDTLDASGIEMGNQFVWIPVASEAELTRTAFGTNGQPTTGLDTNTYAEPYTNGYPGEEEEYNTMKNQVLKYHGFYIGRYEAGVNSTTLRTNYTTNQTVVCKKGVAPYNRIPWGKAMNDINSELMPPTDKYNTASANTNGAVYLAKNMYSTSDSVVSTLVYGCQWDAMCRYIGDSQRTTPTKTSTGAQLTGSVPTDVSKNIYDLAGNCIEWSMEAYGSSIRDLRGGDWGSAFSISYRYTIPGFPNTPNYGYTFGFRPALYIK